MGFLDRIFGKKQPDNKSSATIGINPGSTSTPKVETISLEKSNEVITFSLAKKNVSNIIAEVKMVLDCSGSMYDLYDDGTVQKTIERLAPLAFRFDDNGIMEAMLFNHALVGMPDITIENYKGYSRANLNRVVGGGTSYAPAIRKLTNEARRGCFSYPVFVIFITDGDNSDKEDTRKALREASEFEIYFQFVGIGGASFNFLEEIDNLSGRRFDNAGFIEIENLNKVSDEDLYDQLLDEFVDICKDGTLKTAKVEIIDLSK